VKTTFDLPDPLLRKAKALAADQGRALRDVVAEALQEKLAAHAAAARENEANNAEWKAFEARLQKLPDGTYVNPDGDDSFAELLETIRAESRASQPRDPFAGDPAFDDVGSAPSEPRGKPRAKKVKARR